MYRLIGRRSLSTRAWPRAVREAFSPEISTLEMHSTLLNQVSPRQLLDLTDIKPMMKIYTGLVNQPTPPQVGGEALGNPAQLVVRKVSKALKQTAKDSSFALRSLPQTQRDTQQKILFTELRQAIDTVAQSFVSQKVEVDTTAITQLFAAYEIVDPYQGAIFFRQLGGVAYAGAAIPCLVKSHAPLEFIIVAVHGECNGDLSSAPRWSLANLAWAFLRYNEVEKAQQIFDMLIKEKDTLPPSLVNFILDAFIGDAPLDVALATFVEHMDHAPHHASMTRLLAKSASQTSIDDQISMFANYLDRLQLASELQIKTVSSALVYNVLNATAEPNNEALRYIQEICRVYDQKMREHTILLNILLTEITSRWPNLDAARKLVLAVLQNYGREDSASVVSFRVRLNATSVLSDNTEIVNQLWEERNRPGMPPLAKFDWLALARACRGSKWFFSLWKDAGRPFEHHIMRFCKAYGFL